MTDPLTALRELPIFSEMTEADAQQLARHLTLRSFGRGEVLFGEGEPGDAFFAVVEGRVKIYKATSEGKEQILHVFGPGEMIGEVAVFSGGAYPANAQGLESGVVLHLPRRVLIGLVQKSPDLAFRMLATLSKRLHRFTSLIEDLSLREVPARLAAYLLQLKPVERGERPLVELEISKGQLASLLGTIPETLSRILGRLAGEELIENLSARRVRILDVDGLEEIAAGRRRIR